MVSVQREVPFQQHAETFEGRTGTGDHRILFRAERPGASRKLTKRRHTTARPSG
jgi:hypothetical protein